MIRGFYMMRLRLSKRKTIERALSWKFRTKKFKFILKTTHLKDGGNNCLALTDESVVKKGWNPINRF
jgi:hypothetical protein